MTSFRFIPQVFAAILFSSVTLAESTGIDVVIDTSLGEIVVALNPVAAPVSVVNFLSYVDAGAYDETIFHRVIPGFMVQGGGFYRDLSEAEDGAMIVNEADNGLINDRGSIAMARFDDIDSASRQFFINVDDNTSLDHSPDSCTREDQAKAATLRDRGMVKPVTCKTFGYAVFGRVVSGMEIVDLIELSDTHVVATHDDLPKTPILIHSIRRKLDNTTD